jgi:hypothetical protein
MYAMLFPSVSSNLHVMLHNLMYIALLLLTCYTLIFGTKVTPQAVAIFRLPTAPATFLIAYESSLRHECCYMFI